MKTRPYEIYEIEKSSYKDTSMTKQDSTADIYVTQSLKDSSCNGGWNSIGNGNTRTRVYIEKDGVTITLGDKDIVKLLRSLAPFDGRL